MWWRRRRTTRRSRPVASSWGSCCLALSLWDGGGHCQVNKGCDSVSEMKSLYFGLWILPIQVQFYSYLGLLVHAQLCWTIFRQPARKEHFRRTKKNQRINCDCHLSHDILFGHSKPYFCITGRQPSLKQKKLVSQEDQLELAKAKKQKLKPKN